MLLSETKASWVRSMNNFSMRRKVAEEHVKEGSLTGVVLPDVTQVSDRILALGI